MNYKEYLRSEHWLNFRKNILKERSICQGCGGSKRLNLHHKNYKCLGKETNSDIIILCQPCHYKFHSRKKWKLKMLQGESLDFTGKTNESMEKNSDFYNRSTIMRKCNRCAEMHGIFYLKMSNGKIGTAMVCKNSKPRTKFIKMEIGLDLPIFDTKKRRKDLRRGRNSFGPLGML